MRSSAAVGRLPVSWIGWTGNSKQMPPASRCPRAPAWPDRCGGGCRARGRSRVWAMPMIGLPDCSSSRVSRSSGSARDRAPSCRHWPDCRTRLSSGGSGAARRSVYVVIDHVLRAGLEMGAVTPGAAAARGRNHTKRLARRVEQMNPTRSACTAFAYETRNTNSYAFQFVGRQQWWRHAGVGRHLPKPRKSRGNGATAWP